MKKILFGLFILAASDIAFANSGDVTIINTISPQNYPNSFQYVARSTNVSVSTGSFTKNLSSADSNLQHALNTIDQISTANVLGLPLPPGDTNYIQNSISYQTGSMFYVSSGVVNNAFADSALTPGDCVQAGAAGLLTTTNLPCGSGSGGGGIGASATGTLYVSSSNISQTGISTTPVLLNVFQTAGDSVQTVLSTTTSQIIVSTTAHFSVFAMVNSTGTGVFNQYFFIYKNGANTGLQCQDTPSARCVILGGLSLTAGDTIQIYTDVSIVGSSTITVQDAQLHVAAVGGSGGGGGSGTITSVNAGNGIQVANPSGPSVTVTLSPSSTNYIQNLATPLTSTQPISGFNVTTGVVTGVFTVTQPDNDTTDSPIQIKTLTTQEGAANTYHSAFLYGVIPNPGSNSGEFIITVSSIPLTSSVGGLDRLDRPAIAMATKGNPGTNISYIALQSPAKQFPNGGPQGDFMVMGSSAIANSPLALFYSGIGVAPAQVDSNGVIRTSKISLSSAVVGVLPLANMTSGASYYIQNTNALQSGATAYPSFAYIGSSLTAPTIVDSGITSGQCVQTGTGGLLQGTGSACGSGGGGIPTIYVASNTAADSSIIVTNSGSQGSTTTYRVNYSSVVTFGGNGVLGGGVLVSSLTHVVSAGSYGSATVSPTITFNEQGQIISASSNTISGGSGTPGGPDTSVQSSQGGVFSGSKFFVYDSTNQRVGIGTDTTPGYSLNVSSTLFVSRATFTVLANGFVGFSTNTPLYNIDIKGTGQTNGGIIHLSNLVGSGIGPRFVMDDTAGVGEGTVDFYTLGNNNPLTVGPSARWHVKDNNAFSANMFFETNVGAQNGPPSTGLPIRMAILSTGTAGVGPSANLLAAWDIQATPGITGLVVRSTGTSTADQQEWTSTNAVKQLWVDQNNIINSTGTSIAVSTLTSCGTAPVMGVGGDDNSFTITPGAGAGGCTATFGGTYTLPPTCIVGEETMSLVNALSWTETKTALTITQTSLTSKLDVHCWFHG